MTTTDTVMNDVPIKAEMRSDDVNVPSKNEDTLDERDESLLEGMPKLRDQRPPLPPKIRQHRAPPQAVIVLALGSFALRYGFASDTNPRRLYPAVAFLRRDGASGESIHVPTTKERSEEEIATARKEFDNECDRVVTELSLLDRRRGGGKPIPWKVEIEPDFDKHWDDDSWLEKPKNNDKTNDDDNNKNKENKSHNDEVIVGNDVFKLLKNSEQAKLYDIVFPFCDGHITFGAGAPSSLVRKALDTLLEHAITDLEAERARKEDRAKAKAKAKAKEEAKQKENGKDSSNTKSNGHVRNIANHNSKAGSLKERHEEWLRNNDGNATNFVTLVVPETAQRRDVAELTDAVFRSRGLRCGALFVHQSAVSCALGAGLATCTVVDIGHSSSTIACVEDGIVCGESRVLLRYGFLRVRQAFELLLHRHSNMHSLLVDDYLSKHTSSENKIEDNEQAQKMKSRRAAVLHDEKGIISRICEQAACFNVDENDTLSVTPVTSNMSNRSLRIKLGIGLRAVPAYGLLYPMLLQRAREAQSERMFIPSRQEVFLRNSDDDNFVSDIFNDLRRSGIATAALPIGQFANDFGQPAQTTIHADNASLIDAIVWSIAKAIEVKRPDQTARTPDHYRRYLNAIVLAGGGAKIDGIGPTLEARVKKGFTDIGLNIADVSVIDGGRGKGDEELAAAAAILRDKDKDMDNSDFAFLEDSDTASLPWKGGAVMVEAEAVHEYWLYRDDWDTRNVRALRERVPFYW